jgi:hypothetical protein
MIQLQIANVHNDFAKKSQLSYAIKKEVRSWE